MYNIIHDQALGDTAAASQFLKGANKIDGHDLFV